LYIYCLSFCREAVESRQLEKHEVMNIVSKTEVTINNLIYTIESMNIIIYFANMQCTIEMENHIVNIEFTSNLYNLNILENFTIYFIVSLSIVLHSY
jgi:hypothetical protein